MDAGWKKTVLVAVGILTLGAAGGLIASTALVSHSLNTRVRGESKRLQTLSVTGSARKRVWSDLATWEINVYGDGKDLKSAFPVLKTAYDGAIAFLQKNGFKPDEIASGPIQTTTHHRNDEKGNALDEITGYTLSRSITVTTLRVDAVAKPASEITELIEQGTNISSSAPRYTLSNLSSLKIEMIGEASKDARARADQIVGNLGARIADVRTARVGVMQITKPESTDVSDEGIYDTSTIYKDVRAVVTLTFGMDSEN